MRPQDQQRVNFWRSAWRPVVAITCCVCLVAFTFTVCFLLLTGRATLAEATAIIVAGFTAFTAPLTVMIGGRSLEKSKGQSIPKNEVVDDDVVWEPAPTDFETAENQRIG
ncbi:MAG: hypothetical protein AAF903_12090 [Pseudomonadota bacterium]